jgi:sterol desaturase/sphingolipid hydroxylase (fatty acid hydroxylase superfamily)
MTTFTPLGCNPNVLRFAVFLTLLAAFALAEAIWPRRPLTTAKRQRWFSNLSLTALNSALLRLVALIVPAAPTAVAALAQSRGWGLFNLLQVGGWPELAASLLLLDLLIYFQHRLFHQMPICWQLHRVHHTDLDLDASSGIRFHPLEILLSLAIKLAAVVMLGCSPLSVLLFEILLNATSLFSHANLRIPTALDQWMRLALVTPDMHRVHHSVIVRETNSNYGFNLSCWDRLFGSYRAQPRDGHDRMTIGLKQWRNPVELGLGSLLQIPFQRVQSVHSGQTGTSA